MHSTHIFLSILCVGYLTIVQGHSYFSSISIDGVSHTEGDCIRPHPGSEYDYPISALDRPTGLTSNDMTCGWLPAASRSANRKCAVNPGSTIVLQWHYEMGLASDTFIIDPSHKGPCIVYMAKSDTGAGNVWFKIFEDGYNQATKQWCVDKLRANGGKFTVNIPTDISSGNYLFRAELIALHEGDQLYGAQPYVGCAELTVGGSGTSNPSGVAIPGVYSANDAGIHFDIYTGRNPAYPIPGPALYVSGSGSGSTPNPPAAVTTGKVTTGKVTTGKVTTGKASVTTGASRAVTTGKITTGAPKITTGKQTVSVTTGAAQKITTGAAQKITTGAAQKITTGKQTVSVTTGVAQKITTGTSSDMCYLPGTPNINGKINSSPPTCGVNAKKARCADGQCCSKYGYCGPIKETDGKYYEDGKQVTEAYAFYLYCNATTADYRKVPCSSVGLLQSNNLENANASEAHSLQSKLWMLVASVVLLGAVWL